MTQNVSISYESVEIVQRRFTATGERLKEVHLGLFFVLTILYTIFYLYVRTPALYPLFQSRCTIEAHGQDSGNEGGGGRRRGRGRY